MSLCIGLMNGGVVSLFGSILSASFCGVLGNRRTRGAFWCCAAALPLVQALMYFLWDEVLLRQIYPLITHFPLLVVLFLITGSIIWPLFSILTAYLCCQLRRWFALMVAALLSGGALLQETIELLITLPLLLLLLRFVSPVVRKLSAYPVKRQCQFGMIPALYYGFDYLTRVYTELLSSGSPVAVEFMPFVCCASYLVFLLYNAAEEQKQLKLHQLQKSLDVQLSQAVREIGILRESQEQTRQYRHDLRHHLQYLSSCMENGHTEQAQTYISGICREIEAQTVHRYCENEAANLILSSFVGRARKNGITMEIHGSLPASKRISDQDLCVLLSNALENALHACLALETYGMECTIDVRFYQRDGKLFLQVTNPCGEVRFEKGLPVSDQPGHGIGVQSICAIVQRYGGIYSFGASDGRFVLRLSL